MIIPMIDDKRLIRLIFSGECVYEVGQQGITEIEVYQEPGQFSMVNWFAVFKDEFLWIRIDSCGWGVSYDIKH